MNLKIGSMIYKFRKEKGVTQEQLAQAVGVTVAAVSKWETGGAYPDITMLPRLSRYFKVTIDELMGHDAELSEEQIAALSNECKMLFNAGNFDGAVALCEKYLKEYPREYSLKFIVGAMYMLNRSMVIEDKEKHQKVINRAIQLVEEVIHSDKVDLYNEFYVVLSTLYKINEQYDQAIEALNKIPRAQIDPDLQIAEIHMSRGNMVEAARLAQSAYLRGVNNLIQSMKILVQNLVYKGQYQYALEILDRREKIIEQTGMAVMYRMEHMMELTKVYGKQKDLQMTKEAIEKTIQATKVLKAAQSDSEMKADCKTIDLGMTALKNIVNDYIEMLQKHDDFSLIRSDEAYEGFIIRLQELVEK